MAAELFDLAIVGAGPAGLACAIEAVRAGLRTVTFDRGCITNSLYNFPSQMTFFTTAELLEIGGIPFSSVSVKPSRAEGLVYYRRVVDYFGLDVRSYEEVTGLRREPDAFRLKTGRPGGRVGEYGARAVVLATGYYDNPNLLGVPGEELPKVSHYWTDAHPYFGKEVLVVGGKNSAAIAALELHRGGAKVTLAHRGATFGRMKYWIAPDLENRLEEKAFPSFLGTAVAAIREHEVTLVELATGRQWVIANDYVFALTGYHPDVSFLEQCGVVVDPVTLRPQLDEETLESNVPGLYIAGSLVAGRATDTLFIENGRFHGKAIVQDIRSTHGGGQSARETAPQD